MKLALLVAFCWAATGLAYASGSCPTGRIAPPLRDSVRALKKFGATTLGDRPSKLLNAREEFIFRVNAHEWSGYKWALAPALFQNITLAQKEFAAVCERSNQRVTQSLALDFSLGRVAPAATHAFLIQLLLVLPCARDEYAQDIRELIGAAFAHDPSDVLNVALIAEGEATRFKGDYNSCQARGGSHLIRDGFLRSVRTYVTEKGVNQAFLQHLSELRRLKGSDPSANYVFKKLDKILGN